MQAGSGAQSDGNLQAANNAQVDGNIQTGSSAMSDSNAQIGSYVRSDKNMQLVNYIRIIWLTGMVVMFAVVVVSNLIFTGRLMSSRKLAGKEIELTFIILMLWIQLVCMG